MKKLSNFAVYNYQFLNMGVYMKKYNICLLLTLVLLLMAGCAKKSPPAEGTEKPVSDTDITLSDEIGDFSLVLTCDDEKVDLSGIQINIYKYVPIHSLEHQMSYQKELVFNKKTENGSVAFERPSEFFAFTIDGSTLPEGYRAEETSVFVPYGTSTYTVALSTRADNTSVPDKELHSDETASALISQYEAYHALCKELFEQLGGE